MSASPIPLLSVKTNVNGVTLTMSPGKMKLTVCSARIVRVMYSPAAALPAGQGFAVTNHSWAATPFHIAEMNGALTLTTRQLKVNVNKASGAVSFYDRAGKLLLAEPARGGKTMTPVTVNGESTYQPQQVFDSPANEYIYGLGSFQDGVWNWRGMPEQLRQLNTQISIPMIISSCGYGLLWNNASFTDFNPVDTQVTLTNRSGTYTTSAAGEYVFMVKDGNRRGLIGVQLNGQTLVAITNMWVPYTISGKAALPTNTTVSVTLLGGGPRARLFARPLGDTTTFRSQVGNAIDYYFFYGPSADQIIAGYREATGQTPLFPKAAYGFWQCRERYSSQAQILAAARRFRTDHIPVDFIIQDWLYWGHHGWGAYQWDRSHYPDPAKMIAQLHALHFKYMISVWSNPEGIVGRVLASLPHGLIPGTHWMDVFNPAVRRVRWKYMNRAFFRIGADGFWQDATEPGDDGNALNNVQCYLGSANRVRNAYALFASEAAYDGWRRTGSRKRVVILSRNAYLGEQRYATAVWSGDIHGDWLTFARQIRAGLNFSITGIPYWTTDCGGFFRPRDQYTSPDYNELLTRWFEWSAFCPIMRMHGWETRTEIWNWLPDTQSNLIAYNQLRYRMLPYIYSVAWMVTGDGYTMMRPLVMDFPKDTKALGVGNEYMFGPAFLVCPVTKLHATTRAVYLPAGANWVNFWTGKTLTGGQTVTANAPVKIMPLYVRAGSIVPLGPVMPYATEKPENPIELRIYGGADGHFTLYEDENDNYDYEKGEYATIPIFWTEATHTLEIGKRSGHFPGMLNERTFHIVWVSADHGTGITSTKKPDVVVHYNGKAVKIIGPK